MKPITTYEKMIRKTPIKNINWKEVSNRTWNECDISLSFIREYADYLDWDVISQTKHTKNFYREFKDKIVWWRVFSSEISEKKIKEFIDTLQDEFDWEQLCEYTKLSKKFVERNTELVNWDKIFWQDHLGKKFMIDHKDRFSDDIDIELTFQSWGIDREKSIL